MEIHHRIEEIRRTSYMRCESIKFNLIKTKITRLNISDYKNNKQLILDTINGRLILSDPEITARNDPVYSRNNHVYATNLDELNAILNNPLGILQTWYNGYTSTSPYKKGSPEPDVEIYYWNFRLSDDVSGISGRLTTNNWEPHYCGQLMISLLWKIKTTTPYVPESMIIDCKCDYAKLMWNCAPDLTED